MTNPPRLLEHRDLDPAEIDCSGRLRPADVRGVENIITSYRESGVLLYPIKVRRIKRTGKLKLIAGLHRLEAFRKMEEPVPADIYECTDAQASMMEVDDNLANADLSPIDLAIFLAEHKRLYEEQHPETKAGLAGGLARQGQQTNSSSFAENVAAIRGVTPRQIQKIVAVGERMSRDQIRWLRAAPQPVTLKDLQALAKIEDDHERAQVCIKLSNGEARSVSAARAALGEAPVPPVPVDAEFARLKQAFERASQAARRRFVDECFEPLSDLIADEYERRER